MWLWLYLTGLCFTFFHRDISVLIPKTMQSALDILTDMEVRASCGVEDGNPFTFPSIGSKNHCSGTAELREVRAKLGLNSKLTATSNRHRVATLNRALGIPDDAMPSHLGHTLKVNQQNYQCLPGLLHICKVAPRLEKFGGMKETKSKKVAKKVSMKRQRSASQKEEEFRQIRNLIIFRIGYIYKINIYNLCISNT